MEISYTRQKKNKPTNKQQPKLGVGGGKRVDTATVIPSEARRIPQGHGESRPAGRTCCSRGPRGCPQAVGGPEAEGSSAVARGGAEAGARPGVSDAVAAGG